MYAFKISISKVIKPNLQPPSLKTLVAPIFLDPMFLGSPFLSFIDKMSPKGIEPQIYEKRKIIKNSKFIYKSSSNECH